MKNIEEKHIKFVVDHYEEGRLDTQKALNKFRDQRGLTRPKSNPLVKWVSVAAVVAVGLLVFARVLFMPHGEWVDLSAEGEVLVAYLPDSTKVMLADGSTLSYDASTYGVEDRQVEMSGEAFFEVTRNEQSPFELTAHNAKVEVLGTQFLVTETAESTELYVESGKVRFGFVDGSSSGIFTKGMAGELTEGGVAKVEPSTTNPAAWATGRFVYDNTPIGVVLIELSHFYGVTLATSDPTKRLTASFSVESLDEIIEIIEQVLGVKISKS